MSIFRAKGLISTLDGGSEPYTAVRVPGTLCIGGLGGPHSRSGRCGEEKNLWPVLGFVLKQIKYKV